MNMAPFSSLLESLGGLCEPARSRGWCEPDNGAGGAVPGAGSREDPLPAPAPADTPAPLPKHHHVLVDAPAGRRAAGDASDPAHLDRTPRAVSPTPREVFQSFFEMPPTVAAPGTPLTPSGACRVGQGLPEVLSARLARNNADAFQIDAEEIQSTASADTRLSGILESLSEPSLAGRRAPAAPPAAAAP
jgi:hypothetical protein